MAPKSKSEKKAAAKAEVPATAADTDAEKLQIIKLIEGASEKAPEQIRPYIKQAAPILATAWIYFVLALPYIIQGINATQAFIAALPEKIIYASLGFLVCFFGGIFPATIAAAEAWMLCGGTDGLKFCKELYVEFTKVQDASKKDDDRDDDNDGVADVKELPPKDLLIRKVQIVLRTVDPQRVNEGIAGIYTGWVGVLAILKIQFAKTVTLGEVIGEQLARPASKLEPYVEELVPEDYKKWVPVGIRWLCKATAITVAWWIQRVISAFHSAIRGGQLFGKYLVDYLHERNILKSDSDTTNLDEAIGWGICALGLLFQLAIGFSLPFPLGLFLWPVQLVEGFIVWSVAN